MPNNIEAGNLKPQSLKTKARRQAASLAALGRLLATTIPTSPFYSPLTHFFTSTSTHLPSLNKTHLCP